MARLRRACAPDSIPQITLVVSNAFILKELDQLDSRLLDAGGTADHVHLLISQSKNVSLSSLMKDVKKDSSLWIKTKGTRFRNFHWQDGYGAFSIRRADTPELKQYIASQKEHHRKRSFKATTLWTDGRFIMGGKLHTFGVR